MGIIKLSPLDKEGIRFDRPSHEVVWQRLTNVLFKEGSLVPRPGFRSVYALGSDDFGTAPALDAELGPPVYIGQIRNPGSTSTGREGFSVATETVRPNASANTVAGWTGDHLDIDDATPDGTTYIQTATAGATKKVEFAAMSATYDTIFGAIVRGRARVTQPETTAELTFYLNDNSAGNEIGTIQIAGIGSEQDPWVEFAFPIASVPEGSSTPCQPFDDGTFDGYSVFVKLNSTGVLTAESRAINADGTYSQWKDAVDGGTAVYSDVDGIQPVWANEEVDTSLLHYMAPAFTGDGAGNKQSFKFTLGNTYTSIADITFMAHGSKGPMAEPTFELYWRTGAGAETLIGTYESKLGADYWDIRERMTTNPAGGAWGKTAFEAGEFFIKAISQVGIGTILHNVGIWANGVIDSAEEVRVDYLAIDICGATTTAPGLGLPDFDRLWSTKSLHFRLDADGPTPDITAITNSVGFTHPPNIPVDNAILYGQVYLVNGKDATRVYPNGSDVYTSLTTNNADGATKLTGRTVASFANRILYGWVTDNTTVTPERVSYSKFNDGSTHNHVSAGDFDLLDTPGGVVKLIQLNEDILAGLKEEGVYSVIKTGQAAFPFRRDVIDFETGCVAKMTAKRITLEGGNPGILFLGENPSKGGLNVFLFDGGQVVPVGTPIAKKLREDSNPQVLPYAFAEVDPVTGSYWLFFAEGCDGLLPNSAYIMNVNTFAWTRAEFPFWVSCAGQWNLLKEQGYTTEAGARVLRGERKLILGTTLVYPMEARDNSVVDELKSADISSMAVLGNQGSHRIAFTSTMETGDLVRPNNLQVVSYRLHLTFTVKSYTLRVVISSSEDGGENFNTEAEYNIGVDSDFELNRKKYVILDLTPSHADMVRYKITIAPDTDMAFEGISDFDTPWQIDDIRLELIEAGEGA